MPDPVRILKNGYWDRTAVVRGADGGLRVRKECKGTPGPWAREALRNEISYLQSLPAEAAPFFPPLLDSWDAGTLSYEIPFYEDRESFAELVLRGEIDQAAADAMQEQLAEVVLDKIHRPAGEPSLGTHLEEVMTTALDALADDDQFAPLIEAPSVTINGGHLPGLRRSFDELLAAEIFPALDADPPVLLHGDLILENILWSPLLLIDPVSVAGLSSGHPLFDLVKYVSFASGELFAIREELVAARADGDGYRFAIHWDHPRLAPFQALDLTTTFWNAFLRRHGEIDPRLYALLDAYFSLVMARNTTGVHQWARVLKATETLARAGVRS